MKLMIGDKVMIRSQRTRQMLVRLKYLPEGIICKIDKRSKRPIMVDFRGQGEFGSFFNFSSSDA